MHRSLAPSAWIQRWSHLVPDRGTVLDVACGYGRHLRWFHQRNHAVAGVDRDVEAIFSVASLGEVLTADIEGGPWPFMTGCGAQAQLRRFDAVVVCNYLWRPLLPLILDSVRPGGLLLYETFASGNEQFGKPSRPDFLLQPGELLRLCERLSVVAYEDVYLDDPPRCVQRIAAIKPASSNGSIDVIQKFGARNPELC